MSDLKASFEKMNFTNVTTYIQSGNVIFSSAEKNKPQLTLKIEKELADTFSYKSKIVLLTSQQVSGVMNEVPPDFGTTPEEYKYNVIFLKEPLTASEAIKSFRIREGVDSAYAGSDAIYFSHLISKAGQSYLSKIISLPIYKEMTIRNWNTTSKLCFLMNENN